MRTTAPSAVAHRSPGGQRLAERLDTIASSRADGWLPLQESSQVPAHHQAELRRRGDDHGGGGRLSCHARRFPEHLSGDRDQRRGDPPDAPSPSPAVGRSASVPTGAIGSAAGRSSMSGRG